MKRRSSDTRPRGRRPLLERASAVAIVAAGAILSAGASASASSGGAAVFLSPAGSDSAACTRANPCRSVVRAYEVARLGAVVELAAGSYGDQLLPGKAAKAREAGVAKRIVFRPAKGASVSLGRLEINVPHAEFRQMRIAKWKARYNVDDPGRYAAANLKFVNIRTHHFSFNAVHDVSIIGGEVGPNRNPETGDHPQDGIFIGAYPPDKHPPTNIVIDGVYIHDVTEPNSTAHSDCIQFTAGVNVTIRNSRFRNCEHADMMIKGDQGPIENFLIENNVLDRTLSAHYSINLYETRRGCRNVLIRNNTALQNIRTDACSGATLTGNIQPSMSKHSCSSANVKISWNVYESGVRCGQGDFVAPVSYVDRGAFDLRLARKSAAIARGNPESTPRRDIDGRARPIRGRPDAGAHQRDSAVIRLGASIGGVRLGASRGDVEAFYGRPQSLRTAGGMLRASHHVAGGKVTVLYARGRVAGITTTSPYYTTSSGVGVGSAGSQAKLSNVSWNACRRAHRKVVGGVVVYFTPVGGKPGRSVASLTILRPQADRCRARTRP